jgi:hypothetical protein
VIEDQFFQVWLSTGFAALALAVSAWSAFLARKSVKTTVELWLASHRKDHLDSIARLAARLLAQSDNLLILHATTNKLVYNSAENSSKRQAALGELALTFRELELVLEDEDDGQRSILENAKLVFENAVRSISAKGPKIEGELTSALFSKLVRKYLKSETKAKIYKQFKV